jgi:hypothetical protein
MTRIDIEEVQRLQARLAEINKLPFEEIVWCKNGKPLEIAVAKLYDFKFFGLSNTCFVELGLYDEINCHVG